ncbi:MULTISPECIES: DEAD/DEAH box helicase [Niastella]|uniref:DEAD/DEAH box helicase n=1 Tax=Niastella soli TaxID=2821487 RepID=A0ABS3YVH9_9BACT|nr:DEAD/DEAH box helicase [Niastella soli]MBO9201944.1 DEAD/DEAH box helicase [Niastella soli]
MAFKELNLNTSLLKSLNEQGYSNPTSIQQQAIPHVLAGRDVFGCAQTGTGKTAAFVIPLLQLMQEEQRKTTLRTLIIAPTRELVLQITDTVRALARHTGLRFAPIFGGVPQHSQVQQIRAGLDILVATPGRLQDLMQQRLLSLNQIKYLVLDEADRMLDMGFVRDVKQIIAKLPANRQTLFFSATIPPDIRQLSASLLNNPVQVQVAAVSSAAPKIDQLIYHTEKKHKSALLLRLLASEELESAIVFTQMKHTADRLSRFLNESGVQAAPIHGNRSQGQREMALKNFKARKLRVLVATDIAARGIDIDKLGHVFNFDLPQVAETYVHRIGRTGRAGATGTALSFCSPEERPLLRDIEKLIKMKIPVVEDTTGFVEKPKNAPAKKQPAQKYRPQTRSHRNNSTKKRAVTY